MKIPSPYDLSSRSSLRIWGEPVCTSSLSWSTLFTVATTPVLGSCSPRNTRMEKGHTTSAAAPLAARCVTVIVMSAAQCVITTYCGFCSTSASGLLSVGRPPAVPHFLRVRDLSALASSSGDTDGGLPSPGVAASSSSDAGIPPVADADALKDVAEVVEAHPESVVVRVWFQPQLLLHPTGPQRRSVRPVASPLFVVSRWVAQHDQADAVHLAHLALWQTRGAHDASIRLVAPQKLPDVRLPGSLSGVDERHLLGEAAREILERQVHEAMPQGAITAVVLCEGFLHQRHPDLVPLHFGDVQLFRRLAEIPPFVQHGEEVVQDDVFPDATLEQAHRVDAGVRLVHRPALLVFKRDEQRRNLRIDSVVADAAAGRQHAERGHEPVVTKEARTDVVWIGGATEEPSVRVQSERTVPAAHVQRQGVRIFVVSVEGVVVRWKLVVDELVRSRLLPLPHGHVGDIDVAFAQHFDAEALVQGLRFLRQLFQLDETRHPVLRLFVEKLLLGFLEGCSEGVQSGLQLGAVPERVLTQHVSFSAPPQPLKCLYGSLALFYVAIDSLIALALSDVELHFQTVEALSLVGLQRQNPLGHQRHVDGAGGAKRLRRRREAHAQQLEAHLPQELA
eukprot:scaffold149_cov315-Pinguiococcus_pyrenoidosus.AAC.65